MKILNLYSGIGGNRKLWENVSVTAIEINPDIAKIYQDFFHDDKVIVCDAHEYLLNNYSEYDFIWSSPPCPTHSGICFMPHIKPSYPDMNLYEEIILLKTWFKGLWVVENVKSYYDPLIEPYVSGGHYFWSNFIITPRGKREKVRNDKGFTLNKKMEMKGFEIKEFYNYSGDKRTMLNNCIEPKLGLHILNCAINKNQKQFKQDPLFNATN